MSTNPPLELKYSFTPNPNPIFASVAGSNPNTVDLQVIISNPLAYGLSVNELQITIPVGQDDTARDLSPSTSLPNATPDPSGLWQISVSGGTIKVVPAPGTPGNLGAAPIIFTLPKIQVNHTPGTVPINITENISGSSANDQHTYSIVKQPANFPISQFSANPSVVNDQDDFVTLCWGCTSQGEGLVYQVRCPDLYWLEPEDCLSDGDCFTCGMGQTGVQTPRLASPQYNALFTFYLDVVQEDSSGDRSVIATLDTTVQLCVPFISGNSTLTASHSNRIVRLRWLAFNASKCSIGLNNQVVIDDNAPVNTYANGYPLVLPSSGLNQLVVTAYAQSGPATFTYPFPDVNVSSLQTLQIGQNIWDIAMTPDGKLLLAVDYDLRSVFVVDVPTLTVKPNPIQLPRVPYTITITPDGSLALMVTYDDDGDNPALMVMDIATLSVRPNTIPLANYSYSFSVTPDGSLALWTNLDNTVGVMDVPTLTVRPNPITLVPSALAVFIAPDNSVALVTSTSGLYVLDLPALTVRPNPIQVAAGGVHIAFTPDSKLALLANYFAQTVTVIDMATMTVMPNPLQLGSRPNNLAITPDGTLAFAPCWDSTAWVIDMASMTVMSTPISVGDGPTVMAFTPDSKVALLTCQDGVVDVI